MGCRDWPARAGGAGSRWALASVAILSSACNLGVSPFSGTAIVLELRGAAASAPGHHVELWGRTGHDDIVRISYLVQRDELMGLQIRTAVDPADPCMINDSGYLVTDARAYPMSIPVGGAVQTPDEQAKQAQNHVRQLTSVAVGGLEPATMLVATPYDETPWPALASDAAPDVRRAACQAYWKASAYSYSANPLAWGAPLHGVVLGAIDYMTSSPQQSYQDIALTSPYDLSDLRELWLTDEAVPPARVDATRRGPLLVRGTPAAGDDAGFGVLHVALAGDGPVSGSAALILPPARSAF
jgi:hypothetical protein